MGEDKIGRNYTSKTEFTVLCHRCKQYHDDFTEGEIPEEYGWKLRRKKYYCTECNITLDKNNGK